MGVMVCVVEYMRRSHDKQEKWRRHSPFQNKSATPVCTSIQETKEAVLIGERKFTPTNKDKFGFWFLAQQLGSHLFCCILRFFDYGVHVMFHSYAYLSAQRLRAKHGRRHIVHASSGTFARFFGGYRLLGFACGGGGRCLGVQTQLWWLMVKWGNGRWDE